MVAVPADTPETNPVEELIVAIAVDKELHVPPATVAPKAVVPPAQTERVPVMVATVLIVTKTDAVQPKEVV